MSEQRLLIRIRGLVQGVGFRPHVYRQAIANGITGFALNDGEGVLIEAQGENLDQFLSDLDELLPPLARMDHITRSSIPLQQEQDFRIAASDQSGSATAAIPADVALCDACLGELFDPGDRRYLHPFIACSHCGPRVTMTTKLPYDRINTTMADFQFCDRCRDEYTDPLSRRFHAEPIACHDCGPELSEPIPEVVAAITSGKLVALKGIGGYHLVTDARNSDWVSMMRERKHRDEKPFAVMVLNLASARRHARLSPKAGRLMQGTQCPIVVAPRLADAPNPLPEELSPELHSLGLILPYTAVHFLIFHWLLGQPEGTDWLREPNDVALVFTSANDSGRPLVSGRSEAELELEGIADLIVHHDRRISRSMDDSVVRDIDGQIAPIRRSRGYVPNAIQLARESEAVIACGAHLKNTVTLTRGGLAFPSTHIGDLDTAASIRYQIEAVEQLVYMLGIAPAKIACDWHRDYASTRLAEDLADRYQAELVSVQHHHAHIAAVIAEHGFEGPVLGVALDGHGQGEDGAAWGGELLRVDTEGFRRLGHFRPLPIVGGDRAAREPWRLAAGAYWLLGRGDEIESRFSNHSLASSVRSVLESGSAPVTSAAGRLFDAASGLLGVCETASFDGQAPMILEAHASKPAVISDGWKISSGVLDFSALLAALADCDDPYAGANWLHGTLVQGICNWVCEAAGETGITTVALGGGCMINHYLAIGLPRALESNGLNVLMARQMPPNDAAISLGQAWVASA